MQQINIVGIIFLIEEDALPVLKSYKQNLYQYFSQQKDGKEIFEDIENRIAEIFWENSNASPIALSQVQEMIKQMGDVTDFEAMDSHPSYNLQAELWFQKQETRQEKELVKLNKAGGLEKKPLTFLSYNKELWDISHYNSTEQEERPHDKILYRDTAKAWVGGVAAGLGDYFGVEVWLVRLLVLLSCSSGVLLLCYLFLWWALPQKK